MNKTYDAIILEHYKKVAETDGASPESTMSNSYVRNKETEIIRAFLTHVFNVKGPKSKICEIGCGNGYTLELMSDLFPEMDFIGYEYTPELKEIAAKRLAGKKNVQVFIGDIRDISTMNAQNFDAVYTQRVLINLLETNDQKTGLDNIIKLVKERGFYLFIECFTSALNNLNLARKEFDIEPLPPAHHNLYLSDDYFERTEINKVTIKDIADNFLSSHYYISRVFHPIVLGSKQFQRNSPFVTFFTELAGDRLSGDYSPIKAVTFQKK